MAQITFPMALALILKLEGGYSSNPNDPGGETNLGISKRAYPALDIASLTPETVAPLYKRDYWDQIAADSLPSPLNLLAFDCAVNQGPTTAHSLLQSLADSNDSHMQSAATFVQMRLARYRLSSHWHDFGAGWCSRLVQVLAYILENT